MGDMQCFSLFINNNIYKHKFDFEVIKEDVDVLNITLYNLLDEELKNTDVEIFIENFSIFKGRVNTYNLEDINGFLVLNIEAAADNAFNYNEVDFNAPCKEKFPLQKAKIQSTKEGYKYIQMDADFQANINVGDIISHDQSLYAIESIIYTNDMQGVKQEIHGINDVLHNAKYAHR
ncbi:MAG: hypothetical protein FWE18_05770 [Alphaproteobacteria bacterium]|nr:hypothetical protein [Alphaproteobacteria bacterium]